MHYKVADVALSHFYKRHVITSYNAFSHEYIHWMTMSVVSKRTDKLYGVRITNLKLAQSAPGSEGNAPANGCTFVCLIGRGEPQPKAGFHSGRV